MRPSSTSRNSSARQRKPNTWLLQRRLSGGSSWTRTTRPNLRKEISARMVTCRHAKVDQQIALALRTSRDMDAVLDNSTSMHLTPSEVAELRQLHESHSCLCCALLRHFTTSEGKLLFNVTFKMHWLSHCVDRSFFISPKLGQCYAQEDLMGRVRKLVAISTHGRKGASAIAKTMQRYTRALHFEFSR